MIHFKNFGLGVFLLILTLTPGCSGADADSSSSDGEIRSAQSAVLTAPTLSLLDNDGPADDPASAGSVYLGWGFSGAGIYKFIIRRTYAGVITDTELPGTESRYRHPRTQLAGPTSSSYKLKYCALSTGECSAFSNTVSVRRCAYLYANDFITQDNPLYTCDSTNEWRLYPQADGNLVYSHKVGGSYSQLVWATGAKPGANRLYMQGDGNLVYSQQPANVAKWTSQTGGHPGAHAFISNGIFWIADSQVIWVRP